MKKAWTTVVNWCGWAMIGDAILIACMVTVLFVIVTLMCGCSAPQPKGWTPETKMEMKLLIGQTTMEAIHAYRLMTQQEMKKHGIETLREQSEQRKY